MSLNVTDVGYFVQAAPHPPMGKVSALSITPTTRTIAQGGGGFAVLVNGSGNWTAAVSDDWIAPNVFSGSAGTPLAYTVGANTNCETRVGYVYIAGYTHTITQPGVGGEISPAGAEFENVGGKKTVTVNATNRMMWRAKPNDEWLSVDKVSGSGAGSVVVSVAPWDQVSTRSGTLTIAGETFSVLQYGRRMKLNKYADSCDYQSHVFAIVVNALASTTWSVTPKDSWLSVVDAGNGHGGDTVTIAVAENPSYKARTGTVKIGTETFKVSQAGRTDLTFSISPMTTTAAVTGANGLISVYATPDLPWTAESKSNWLTIYDQFESGAGNGNVVYNASPNPTLYSRTGSIVVTPTAASGKTALTHKVTQPAAQSKLDKTGYEFAAAGESVAVTVTVDSIVEWSVVNLPSWLTASATSFVGPGAVTLRAAENESVYARSATIKIAEKNFKVTQKARGVELEYDTKLFGTDGGDESISVHPDGNVAWNAVASDSSWIIIYSGASGTGDAEVLYIVAPYVGTSGSRTGTITIGNKTVYITQRAYALDISPNGTWVNGNKGAGEIGVTASVGAVWNAIVTEPWIAIVSGYSSGTGSGTVRFTYTENDTGKQRTGKIVVAGEVYTLTQTTERPVVYSAITYTNLKGASHTNPAQYEEGKVLTFAAPTAVTGYTFSKWSPEMITETMSGAQSVAAVWTANSYAIRFNANGGDGTMANIACTYDKNVTLTANAFTRKGYTFLGWSTSAGAKTATYADKQTIKNLTSQPGQTVTLYAVWQPYTYTVSFNANGGSGTMADQTFVYGTEQMLAANAFTRKGYVFRGWSTSNSVSAEIYGDGQWVVNLADQSNATVTLFAIWEDGPIEVRAVVARQRYPWNGLVDIDVDFSANWMCSVAFEVWDVSAETNLHARTFYLGDPVAGVRTLDVLPGVRRFVWDAGADLGEVVIPEFSVVATVRKSIYEANVTGGTGSGSYRPGETVSLVAAAKAGYSLNWNGASEDEALVVNSSAPSTTLVMPSRDVTFSVAYTANSYTITFNANGGSGTMANQKFTYDTAQALTANVFTRTGYTFLGWGESAGATTAKYTDKQSVKNLVTSGTKTLYAVWQANAYTVAFNANGGSGTMANESFVYNTAKALTANAFTRTGYTFLGWGESASATTAKYTDKQSVKNLAASGTKTLYAVWTANSYTVVFDANGGNGTMASQEFTYGAAQELTANSFTRTGYPFLGWGESASATTAKYTDKQSVKNLAATGTKTLYAVWDSTGVLLWQGGPYWSACNVGATKPEEAGYYFGWGDTVGYKRNASNDGWVSVKNGAAFSFTSGNSPTYNKTMAQLQLAGYIDSTGNLVAAHDAANVHLGAPWRMPTSAEYEGLIANCTITWTTENGVYGMLAKGKGDFSSMSIFIPAAGTADDTFGWVRKTDGYCWSASIGGRAERVWYLEFWSSVCDTGSALDCYYGMPIRPVRNAAK